MPSPFPWLHAVDYGSKNKRWLKHGMLLKSGSLFTQATWDFGCFLLQCLHIEKPHLRPLTQAELAAGIQKAKHFMAGFISFLHANVGKLNKEIRCSDPTFPCAWRYRRPCIPGSVVWCLTDPTGALPWPLRGSGQLGCHCTCRSCVVPWDHGKQT